jgi:phage head maturation protease
MKNNKIKITGKFQNYDTPDLNGRIYNKEFFSEALVDYQERRRKNGVAYGELNSENWFNVSLTGVSHIIKKIEEKDDGIYGTIEILNTPRGKEVLEKIKSGYKPIVSPRYYGHNDKISKLISFDVVGFTRDEDEYEDTNFEEWTEE